MLHIGYETFIAQKLSADVCLTLSTAEALIAQALASQGRFDPLQAMRQSLHTSSELGKYVTSNLDFLEVIRPKTGGQASY